MIYMYTFNYYLFIDSHFDIKINNHFLISLINALDTLLFKVYYNSSRNLQCDCISFVYCIIISIHPSVLLVICRSRNIVIPNIIL
jgi:uncharacterized membrane protein YesL